MEGIILAIILFGIFLFIFYLIIKGAVSRGIDESTELQFLKDEIRELNKRLKRLDKEQ